MKTTCHSKLSPFEVRDALESMMILVDTREQDTPRFRKRVESFPRWRREKLDYGDYGCEISVDGQVLRLPVAVERKMSLDELCSCFTHERARFQREFEGAKEAGIRLWLLVENADWEKIYAGEYRSRLNADALIASILAWSIRYNMKFVFCKPQTTGPMIRKILHYEAREYLENWRMFSSL